MAKTITKLADQLAPVFTTITEIRLNDPELYARIGKADSLLLEALTELMSEMDDQELAQWTKKIDHDKVTIPVKMEKS
tara:strand:- start:129 stop:362 length:234 start_codon:yes stop_codon:yes gene_type:complete